MSKYTILFILTLPLIAMGILNACVKFNLKKIGTRKLVFRIAFWVFILFFIVFLEPIYNALIAQGLTDSDPLSLFDVIMITSILFLFLISTKSHSKINALEDRLNRLHRQLSIQSKQEIKKKK